MIRATFCFCFVMCSWVWASNEDYKMEVAKEKEREQKAAQREQAPIYSRRCERKGMDTLVTKADQQPYKLHCIPRRVLEVKA